jgi:hypothetical protein
MNKSMKHSPSPQDLVDRKSQAAQARHHLIAELEGKVRNVSPFKPTKAQRFAWITGIRAVSEWRGDGRTDGVLIMGAPGRGKSELLKAIAWMLAASGKKVRWVRPSLHANKAGWEIAQEIGATLLGHEAVLFNDITTRGEADFARSVILNAADAGVFVGIATNLKEERLYDLFGEDLRINNRQSGWVRITMPAQMPDMRKKK